MKKNPGRQSRRKTMFKGMNKLDRSRKKLRSSGQESKRKSKAEWERIKEAQKRKSEKGQKRKKGDL